MITQCATAPQPRDATYRTAREIHTHLGAAWPAILARLGIADTFLRLKKAGPCPACGGADRYTFDNRTGRGDFFCRGCGAGDGFALLQRVHGWQFNETLRRVAEVAGINSSQGASNCPLRPSHAASTDQPARPPARVRDLLRDSCLPDAVEDVVAYLTSRGLWPLPAGCTLKAHATAEYWHDRERIGRYAALLATVRDNAGAAVTAHITYLQHGRKLAAHEPRKLLSPLTGRSGCAVRLLPLDGDLLGIGEGLETSLAAYQLHQLPTWAALTAVLLARFEPPAQVRRLVIFADRDAPGLEAAARLIERLQGRVHVELRLPPPQHKDFNEVLMARAP